MSTQSNNNGRAYEFACLNILNNEINKYRKCIVQKNSSYEAAKNAWDKVSEQQQELLLISAVSVVDTGITITTTKETDPVNVKTKVSMVALPSLEGADYIIQAKVY